MSLSATPARNAERRTVAYIRVSTEDQAKEGNSLSDQERQARAYAVARDWGEVAEVYADPGVSGATRNRPALTRLLAGARAGSVGRVIVSKLDRMSRRAVDLLAIEDELDTYGVERIYIKDSIDTSTPTGRLLRTVLAAVAELERDIILERTTAGKLEAISRGDVWRSRGLFGYRYLPVDKANGQRGRLEIDETTAPLVRRIFAEVANGTPLRTLAAQLNAEGVPTHRGGVMWRHNALQRIVTNPAYTGKAAYGRHRRVKVGKDKTAVRKGDPDKVLYADVPAIVSAELAQAAQAMLAHNKATATRNAKHEYLLGGGLLRCATRLADGRVCGSVMHGESHHGLVYRCNHQTADGQRRHRVPAALLDERVWGALVEMMRDPGDVLDDLEALANAGSAQVVEAEAEMAALEQASSEVTQQQDKLLDLYLTDRLDDAAYDAKATALAAKRQSLMDRHTALVARRDAAKAHQLPIAEIRAMCQQIAGRLERLTFEQRRLLIRTLFMSIVVDRTVAKVEGVFDDLSATVNLNGVDSQGDANDTIVDTTSGRYAPPRRLRGRV